MKNEKKAVCRLGKDAFFLFFFILKALFAAKCVSQGSEKATTPFAVC